MICFVICLPINARSWLGYWLTAFWFRLPASIECQRRGKHAHRIQDRSTNKGAQSVKMKDMRDQHVIFGINTRNAWGKLTTATAGQRAHVACPIECPLISNVKGAPSGTWISLFEKVETVPSFVPRWRDLLSSESTFFALSLSQGTQKRMLINKLQNPF